MDQIKRCSRCGQHLPYSAFNKDRYQRDGLVTRCKACLRILRGSVLQRRPSAKRDVYGKTCPRCRTHKPWSEYQKSLTVADGHQSYCRVCAYEYEQAWDRANPEINKARHAEKLSRQVDPAMTKKCVGCGKRRPHIEFYAHRSTKDGRAGYCRVCALEYQVKWRTINWLKAQEYNRRRPMDVARKRASTKAQALWRYRRYGLDAALYDELLSAQANKCAICGEPGETWEHRNLQVDHDHEANIVRGLLCASCNWGLGNFKDRTQFLSAAIEYLRSPPAQSLREPPQITG